MHPLSPVTILVNTPASSVFLTMPLKGHQLHNCQVPHNLYSWPLIHPSISQIVRRSGRVSGREPYMPHILLCLKVGPFLSKAIAI